MAERQMIEVTNADRSRWALEAVEGFAATTGADTARDAIADLISNLLHLAHGRALDTDRLVKDAAAMFRAEAREDPSGDIATVQSRFRRILPEDS